VAVFTIWFLHPTGTFPLKLVLAGTVNTQANPTTIEPGLGAEYRPLIVTAISHIKERRLAEAGAVLDQGLVVFREGLTDPEAINVSVPT